MSRLACYSEHLAIVRLGITPKEIIAMYFWMEWTCIICIWYFKEYFLIQYYVVFQNTECLLSAYCQPKSALNSLCSQICHFNAAGFPIKPFSFPCFTVSVIRQCRKSEIMTKIPVRPHINTGFAKAMSSQKITRQLCFLFYSHVKTFTEKVSCSYTH